jgi:hypothetical protein
MKRGPQDISCLSRGSLGAVEMQEREANSKDSIEYILASLLEILSQDKRANVGETSLACEPMKIYASAEEGARLIRVFVRIKQPELRAAIMKLATQIADVRASSKPAQS